MKVKDILDRAAALYNDVEYIRVSESHYLKFLDDALNQLVLSRPDSHVKNETVKLVRGTKQELPEDGYTLIDIYMNKKLTDDGTFENYRPVTHVKREDMDHFSDWQSPNIRAYDKINEFAYDPRSPRIYWVSPTVGDTDIYVEMDYSYGFTKYGEMQVEVAREQEIDLSDVFLGPILAYMLYLLYSTDSTSVNDRQIAAQYLQTFFQSVGMEYNANQTVIPKADGNIPVVTGGAQ